jgi:phage protein, head-tail joining protein
MTIFKQLFSLLWAFFDVIMFLAAAITINVTMYFVGWLAFGVCLTVTFILTGFASEILQAKKEE